MEGFAIQVKEIALGGVPYGCTWQLEPPEWDVEANVLELRAAPRTDLFNDPRGRGDTANAAMLLFLPEGDFVLQARVEVAFAATFDAAVLVAYQDAAHWAKLCFEYTPDAQPSIVSVVTHGRSDDANGVLVAGNTTHLRLSRMGAAWAMHHSSDAQHWQLKRLFSLPDAPTRVGFLGQSPTGEGAQLRFSEIQFVARRLEDERSGA